MPLNSHNLYDSSDVRLSIYSNASFTCSGELVGWEFTAQATGVFWASVWDFVGNGTYKLMGSSRIEVQ